MKYKRKDFIIYIIHSRYYGSRTNGTLHKLVYADITNVKTGVNFHDWVKPAQLRSMKELNELIIWEKQ